MPTILMILLLMSSEQGQAAMGNCPTQTLSQPSDVRMIQFLQDLQGRYQLGSCSVEIQTCVLDDSANETRETLIADMLIVDQDGFERYIPFYVPQVPNSRSRQIDFQNPRMLHYKFQDHNPDNKTGKDERWAVEFVKTPDLKNLEYIEVAYSSEMQRAQKIPKKWIICGTERETEIRNRPLHHKVKSWWHLLFN